LAAAEERSDWLRDGKWGGEAADRASLLAKGRAISEPRHSPTRPKGGAAPKNDY